MIETLGSILFFITVLFALYYALLIGKIWTSWNAIRDWIIPYNNKPNTKISVIIAARNEEAFIQNCVSSILKGSYPSELLEIIIIDDHSIDATVQNVLSLNNTEIIQLIHAENQGKKNAISQGIAKASGDLIVCTDADCTVPKNWLLQIESLYSNSKARVICGMVKYTSDKSLVQRFQYLDNLNNMATTAVGISSKEYYLANGANIAFEKSLFEEINGYEDNKAYASGDDIFLVNKAAGLDKNNVLFLKSKESIVSTQPQMSWSSLKIQRQRWASKSKGYAKSKIVKIQAIVFLFVLVIFGNIIFSFVGLPICIFSAMIALLIKSSIDYLYLSRMSDYFGDRTPLKSFLPLAIVYLFYILMAGYWAITTKKYTWKGRTVK